MAVDLVVAPPNPALPVEDSGQRPDLCAKALRIRLSSAQSGDSLRLLPSSRLAQRVLSWYGC